mmetsp:Transcript_7794/g.17149  ORF Transcript_7794/g.17149 Transcript_7794/m.17149 type:complete len:216 (+) Transcript_7794:1733-2380(+)
MASLGVGMCGVVGNRCGGGSVLRGSADLHAYGALRCCGSGAGGACWALRNRCGRSARARGRQCVRQPCRRERAAALGERLICRGTRVLACRNCMILYHVEPCEEQRVLGSRQRCEGQVVQHLKKVVAPVPEEHGRLLLLWPCRCAARRDCASAADRVGLAERVGVGAALRFVKAAPCFVDPASSFVNFAPHLLDRAPSFVIALVDLVDSAWRLVR